VNNFDAGYIDKENEVIVGLQTDMLLKRAMKPFGGFKVVQKALSEHGLVASDTVSELFSKYVKSHNDGVFAAYNAEIRKFRSNGLLTGLPDNYARGRIIGDYRRVALYGINALIEAKKADLKAITGPMTDAVIRLREEVSDQ
ncbi:pyruvate formate lyase family protein, partial [Seonamhaeicola marinus]